MEDAVRTHRRMAAVAILGALAAAALSSCGMMQPDTAASVGSTTITERQVDQMVDGTGGKADRDVAVQVMVLEAVCRKYAGQKKISFDPAAMAAQVTQEGYPAGAFADLRASMYACLQATSKTVTTPSEDDMHKFYDDAKRLGVLREGVTYEQLKPQMLQDQEILPLLTFRRVLITAAEGQDVSVNPRYRALSYPLGEAHGVPVDFTLGEQPNAAVTDAPKPASTQPAPAQPPGQPTN
jgi:hypothetical protein